MSTPLLNTNRMALLSTVARDGKCSGSTRGKSPAEMQEILTFHTRARVILTAGAKTVAKSISCRDVGLNCDFAAKAETREELLHASAAHARETHGLDSISRQLMPMLQAAIRVLHVGDKVLREHGGSESEYRADNLQSTTSSLLVSPAVWAVECVKFQIGRAHV